jgi:hypothetical protein
VCECVLCVCVRAYVYAPVTWGLAVNQAAGSWFLTQTLGLSAGWLNPSWSDSGEGISLSPSLSYFGFIVSRLLRTAAIRVRDQVRSCGICGGRSGIESFGSLCQPFHPLLHTHHYPSSEACTIGHTVVAVRSGLSLIPPQRKTISGFVANQHCSIFIHHRFLRFPVATPAKTLSYPRYWNCGPYLWFDTGLVTE